jgi:hypothetical protein
MLMAAPLTWTLTGLTGLTLTGLAARRLHADRQARRLEARLIAPPRTDRAFTLRDLDGLPEPAQRYLRHALAPGTPLDGSCRLWMRGSMVPSPGAPSTKLRATETLAPRRGFVWSAQARLNGVPVRVRDHYFGNEGGVEVVALGVLPVPLGNDADVTRSSRGRLVGEAVWCPPALVHPSVEWEAVDAEHARYTIRVDGAPVSATIRVAPDGTLREVTMLRWGQDDDGTARPLPYGFRADAERTFGGVTIPTRITGGWHYGTDRFDLGVAASFTVLAAQFPS